LHLRTVFVPSAPLTIAVGPIANLIASTSGADGDLSSSSSTSIPTSSEPAEDGRLPFHGVGRHLPAATPKAPASPLGGNATGINYFFLEVSAKRHACAGAQGRSRAIFTNPANRPSAD
jgi:hypothetical protein